MYRLIFILQIFLLSCSVQKNRKVEAFLEKLLLEEGGVYTLLGDKPITDMLIYLGDEADISLDNLSPESLVEIEYIDDQTAENWRAWKQFANHLTMEKFRFFERSCSRDPLYIIYMIVNKESLRNVLNKYKTTFIKEIGRDFNVEEVLQELDNSHSPFWIEVFKSHYLSGLLYGFGEENCHHFMRMVSQGSRGVLSENFKGPVTKEHFPLPVFSVSPQDASVKKYVQERERIKQFYKKKDFFKATLKVLQEPP